MLRSLAGPRFSLSPSCRGRSTIAGPWPTDARNSLWRGFWATSLGTLASRVLGLVRDMATAALLGLGEGGVMDAFVVAFRVPNLLRRIFGEGALAASFLPVFSAELERDPRRAWQLLSVLFAWLAVVLVLARARRREALAPRWPGWRWQRPGDRQLDWPDGRMLPYLVCICLAAQASAALQALFSFRWPALSPVLLNVCWLAAVWGVAPCVSPDKLAQAYVIAGAILVSGVLQLAVQLPALREARISLRFRLVRQPRGDLAIGRSMVPITLGMAVTQLNTIVDSLIAWGLSAPPGGPRTIAWLGGAVGYPMQTGAAAAIYYGERFYQLPVALLGMADRHGHLSAARAGMRPAATAPDRRRPDAGAAAGVVRDLAGRRGDHAGRPATDAAAVRARRVHGRRRARAAAG